MCQRHAFSLSHYVHRLDGLASSTFPRTSARPNRGSVGKLAVLRLSGCLRALRVTTVYVF